MRPLVVPPHGVNNGPDARAAHPGRVKALLLEQGFDVDVAESSWSSLDSFLADGVASLLDERVMRGHETELLEGFEGAQGLRRIMHDARRQRRRVVLLPHSWGCVLTYRLKARYRWLRDVPMVGIGSPHTHPSIGYALRWQKRVPAWPKDRGPPPVFVGNRDDKICAASRWLPTLPPPKGTEVVWVKHDGRRQGATQEHEPWQYIATDGFKAAFREALT